MPLNRFLLFILFFWGFVPYFGVLCPILGFCALFWGFVPYFGFCAQRLRRKMTKSSVELNITMLGT